jgi:hypothetical protein
MSAFKAKAASQLQGAPCPLLAQSGHACQRGPRQLSGVKRTPLIATAWQLMTQNGQLVRRLQPCGERPNYSLPAEFAVQPPRQLHVR